MAIAGIPVTTSLLTKENILKKITTYDIYRYYFGPFKVNEVCINHFRGEKDESFIIGNKKSMDLTHKDFGDDYWSGDAFHLVEQIYKVDFFEALRIIDKDFGLGLADNNETIIKPKVIEWEQPVIKVVPPPSFIVETQRFTKEELKYWGEYFIGEDDLKREHIYSIKNLWRNRRRIPANNLLRFGYYDPISNKWKIYRPHGEKGKQVRIDKRKWDGNFEWNLIENIENIDFSKMVWFQKSRKDRLVFQKVLETNNIASIQAEDIACYDKRYEGDIVAIGDNDVKGLKYTKSIRDNFGWKTLNPSEEFQPLTDFADIVKEKGLKFVKNILNYE